MRRAAAAPSRPHHAVTAHGSLARWLLLLSASCATFALLVGLWTWLPPSTVLGVTAQAQQQQHQQQQHQQHQRADPAAHSGGAAASTHPSSAAAATASPRAAPVAAGRSLAKQAKQQLLQQRQEREAAAAAAKGDAGAAGGSRAHIRGASSGTSGTSGGGSMAAAGAAVLVPPSARVVVVGGGLAGLAAALQAAECLLPAPHAAAAAAVQCPPLTCAPPPSPAAAAAAPGGGGTGGVDVLLVEKMPRLGGNSAKASSGMNALLLPAGGGGGGGGGGDSEELFEADVLASGGGASVPELVHTLVAGSPSAAAFLEAQGVSLAGVTRLGGHSAARTRTVVGGANVGWDIMSALMARVRQVPNIRVLEGYTLRRIVTAQPSGGGGGSAGGGVTGVELAAAGPDGVAPEGGAVVGVACGALVLATGGFAANRELLRSVAPEAAELATTNGPWARGEALALAAAAGAALVGLSDVQVHPTGFVDPADPGAGTKFLAPEKLRGVGGILLDDGGSRFVNELGTRDVVAAAVGRLPRRAAWLLLGRDAAAEFGSGAVDFYCKRGLMKRADTLDAAAAAMGVPLDALNATLSAYAAAAARHAEAQGAQAGTAGGGGGDGTGKAVFPHPPHPASQLPLFVGAVTPVVHYTMGGVAINARAQALRNASEGGGVVPGLYAAGEASGGVHGHNRLGGNSLLECVVFGRIAGAEAAKCRG